MDDTPTSSRTLLTPTLPSFKSRHAQEQPSQDPAALQPGKPGPKSIKAKRESHTQDAYLRTNPSFVSSITMANTRDTSFRPCNIHPAHPRTALHPPTRKPGSAMASVTGLAPGMRSQRARRARSAGTRIKRQSLSSLAPPSRTSATTHHRLAAPRHLSPSPHHVVVHAAAAAI